jgi:hypothetical protein
MTERKKRKTKRGAMAMADGLKEVLFMGRDWGFPDFEEDFLRDVWNMNRERLTEEFVRDWPGRRPWAFWKFDVPEEKFLILGESSYYDAFEKGKWRVVKEVESEVEYLLRSGLLLPGELEKISNLEHDVEFREKRLEAHRERVRTLPPGAFIS